MSASQFFGLEDFGNFPLASAEDGDFAAFQEVAPVQAADFRQAEPQSPAVSPGAKKRRIVSDSPDDNEARKESATPESNLSDEAAGNGGSGTLKITDAIDRIAAEGNVLKYDAESQVYVVLDGAGFESRFQQLRTVRAKRNERAQPRPFSKLHVHYILVRGDKWGKTGTAFRAKEAASELHACDRVEASKVLVNLMPSDETESFQVTLQHFLNVIGAGDDFKHAKHGTQTSTHAVHNGFTRGELHGLHSHAVGDAVFDMWHSGAKGDQGYWFERAEGETAFNNGAIVKLVDGRLRRDDFETAQSVPVYLAVSDCNVKWKGEPLPSPEREALGHWCCFLGQIPVTVRGTVRSGDHIGPAGDGSGEGVVCGGEGAVVGIAMDGKEGEAAGVVKTMCFVGLNAMQEQVGTRVAGVLAEAVRARREVEGLRGEVACGLAEAERERRELEARVEVVELRIQGGGGGGDGEGRNCSSEFAPHKQGSTDTGSDVDNGREWGAGKGETWKRRWRLLVVVVSVLVVLVGGLGVYLAIDKGGGDKVVIEQTVIQEVVTHAVAAKCTDHLSAEGCGTNSSQCVWADLRELGFVCLTQPVEVDCDALGTQHECDEESMSQCTFVPNTAFYSGGGCKRAEDAELARCDMFNLLPDNVTEQQRTAACNNAAKCEWRVASGTCEIRPEFDPANTCTGTTVEACEADERCTWAGGQGVVGACMHKQDKCNMAASEAECHFSEGCAWAQFPTADGPQGECVVLSECEGIAREEGCGLLQGTPLQCVWEDGKCVTPAAPQESEEPVGGV